MKNWILKFEFIGIWILAFDILQVRYGFDDEVT